MIVSIRKSGTHLLKELATALGFFVHGDVAATTDESIHLRDGELVKILKRVYDSTEMCRLRSSKDARFVESQVHTAIEVYFAAWREWFGSPHPLTPDTDETSSRLVRRLLNDPARARFEDQTAPICWIVHELDPMRANRAFIDKWLTTATPTIVLGYRDPRDCLISMVRFLTSPGDDAQVGLFREHRLYRQVLMALDTLEQRITLALSDSAFPGMRTFEDALWLRYHPSVVCIRFEDLVGPAGGGSAKRQREAVARVASGAGLDVDVTSVAARLYNPNAFSFRRGAVGDWRRHFTAEHCELFERRYGHVLAAYGADS